MNFDELENAVVKVIEEWESHNDNLQTRMYIEQSPCGVKSCHAIIDEAIRIFVSQNNL